jgi:hypothetical protein
VVVVTGSSGSSASSGSSEFIAQHVAKQVVMVVVTEMIFLLSPLQSR